MYQKTTLKTLIEIINIRVKGEKKMSELKNKDLAENNSSPKTIDQNQDLYDDDMYLDDVYSLRRRLQNIEKIVVVLLALISFPISLGILYGLNYSSQLLTYPGYIYFIVEWLVSFLLIIFLEFATKNVSILKGLLQTFFVSSFFSFFISLATSFIWETAASIEGADWLKLSLGAAAFYVIILTICRIVFAILDKHHMKITLIVGPKDDAENLARKLLSEKNSYFKIRYIFYEIDGKISDKIFTKFKNVNEIILLNTLTQKNKQRLMYFFTSSLNKDLYLCSNYFDIIITSLNSRNIGDMLAFEQRPLRINLVEGIVKRIMDIVISSIFLILTLPVWLIVPLAIKLYDRGPVFYSQVRLTKDMKEFQIYKFRSMKVDAEKYGGAQLAKAHDDRITPIGKFIRATRLDEIPQIINILKGDMSFVGPRPERPEFVKEFLKENEIYRYRYNVKAGLTGLQQVKCTYHTDFNDKLRYDLNYISEYSIGLDFYIILMTIKTVLSKGMAEGVTIDNVNFHEFLKAYDHEFNQHDDYIRVLNHKRHFDDETGIIIPLKRRK